MSNKVKFKILFTFLNSIYRFLDDRELYTAPSLLLSPISVPLSGRPPRSVH